MAAEVTVVRIIARMNVGGPALHVANLAELPGFRTVVVCGVVQEGEAEMEAAVAAAGVRRIPELGRAVRPLDDLRSLRAVYRLLRAERPQIVHTHTAKAGTIGRIAALLAGVPIRVHTYHGHVFHGYFGPWQSRLVMLVERLLAGITTRVVVLSEKQRTEIARDYRIAPEKRISIVPLGLNLPHAADPTAARKAFRASIGVEDQIVVANVGRMVPIKNQRLLIDAFTKLENANAVLVFVGRGGEEASLRAAAHAAGLNERIRFAGWRSDLAEVYAGADIVALSSNNEGTPVCLIEAISAGCPVISTDVGGVRDVLENGRLGVLVPAGDARAFARALDQLIRDLPARRAAIAQAAGRVRAAYGVQRLQRDISALYHELLRQS